MFQGLTCCSKIMFGAIPGLDKVQYHARFPDQLDFARMLLDLTDLVRPDLFLVDGIVGMDGEGPSRGRRRELGFLMSGSDGVGMDLAVCRIVGLDPGKIPVLIASEEYGTLPSYDDLELDGDGISHHLEEPFKPAISYRIVREPPRVLKRIFINMTNDKPVVNGRRCIGCGVCRDNCAGSAITITDGRARIDYSRCIRCYCCHELCPADAVRLAGRPYLTKSLKRMVLKRILRRG